MDFSSSFQYPSNPVILSPWISLSSCLVSQILCNSHAILMVVHWLTKQAIFILTHDTITSAELAKLFVLHVFSKHEVPSHVTSDWGSEFVSHFFHSLGKALDMTLHFTSRYHLEGDRQTEHTNQMLEQYIQAYNNYCQENWSELLPHVEFTYINAKSITTGILPFFTTKGTTWTSRFIPNKTSLPPKLKPLQLTLTKFSSLALLSWAFASRLCFSWASHLACSFTLHSAFSLASCASHSLTSYSFHSFSSWHFRSMAIYHSWCASCVSKFSSITKFLGREDGSQKQEA